MTELEVIKNEKLKFEGIRRTELKRAKLYNVFIMYISASV